MTSDELAVRAHAAEAAADEAWRVYRQQTDLARHYRALEAQERQHERRVKVVDQALRGVR